jgi:hypothetical protein
MPVKLLVSLLLLVSVLWWPWWVSLFIFLICQSKWPPFYPALGGALLYDLLYFPPSGRWLWSPALALVGGIMLSWPFFRRYLRL